MIDKYIKLPKFRVFIIRFSIYISYMYINFINMDEQIHDFKIVKNKVIMRYTFQRNKFVRI